MPEITGPSGSPGSTISSKSIAENTAEVHVCTANEPVTWSLSAGDDADKFSISNDGKLRFIAAPDFEAPTDTADTAGNNTYVVTVKAEDSTGNTAEQTVTVSVSNLDPLYPGFVFDPIGDTSVGSTITLIKSVQLRSQCNLYSGKDQQTVQTGLIYRGQNCNL